MPDRTTAAAALLAAALLAGCKTMIPPYQRPAAPVAAAFPQAEATPAAAASEIGWRDYFGDPRLQRLVELALANNRDLRVAALAVEQARAQHELRRAELLPNVGIGASGTRQPTGTGRTSTLYSAGFTLTGYELDFFGRLRSASAAAQAQLLASAEARRTVQIGLVAAVASAYLNLQTDDALLAVTRRTLATREESLRLTRLRFDNGATSAFELRQAESLSATARVALAQQTRQRALDENALALLVGAPLPADLPPGLAFGEPAMLAALPVGLPSEVLVRRPDIRQAEEQLIAANANIGAARAAFFPRITLTASVGSASSELSSLFSSGTFAWTLAPQLLLPIFDAGRNRSNLAIAETSREIAVAQYEKAIQTAFREVADALAGQATLAEQLAAQRAQAQAEESRFRLAELRFRNGVSSSLDVLDAQRAAFLAQQAVVQAQAQESLNRVLLYKVLGGGVVETAAR